MLISVKKKLLSLAFSLVDAFGKTKLGSMLYQRIAASTMANQAAVEHDGLRLSFVVPNYVNWWRVDSFSSKEPETLEWIDGFEDAHRLLTRENNTLVAEVRAESRR